MKKIILVLLLFLVGCQAPETNSYPQGNEQIQIRGLKPAVSYDLPALGANFVELEWLFSIDPENWVITADESKLEIRKKIARAHEQGLKVYLLPFLHFKDRPGAVGAATVPDIDRFMAQLNSLAIGWAKFAEENKVELFTPVNELQHWIGREEGNIGFIRAGEWYQHILPEIRKVYSGELMTGYNSFSYDLIQQNVSDYEIDQTGYDYISLSLVPHRIRDYEDYTLLVDHLIATAEHWKEKFGTKGIIVAEIGVPESSDSLYFYQQGEQNNETYGAMRAHLYDIFFSKAVGKIDGFFISDWGAGEMPFYLDESGRYVVKPQSEETVNIIKKYYLLEGEREALEGGMPEVEPPVMKEAKTILPEKGIAPAPEEKPLTFEQAVWKKRIGAAFAPSDCKPVSGPTFGESYQGKLIDTHYHIANIPDSSPREEGDEMEDGFPVLGKNIKITDIVCTLEQENTAKAFAFFPAYPEIPEQMIEVAKKTMERYPDTFVPFIMPPDHDDDRSGSPTVDAETLQNMLNVAPGLFLGYGEIGLYARENGAKELPPDSQRLLTIYPIIRQHKLTVYFHLGERHKESFERILAANPDINFIFHGDQLISNENGRQNLKDVEDIIKNHPNVFYTIDELYGDEWLIRPEVTKEEFLEHLGNYEALLEEDLSTWKGIIEKYPNQFMWGTDRSDQVLWSHDPEVGQALANYARAFIAHLNPEVQEKFAYKNAERLIEMSGENGMK